MPENKITVGATHDFHSVVYASWWADRFEVTKERHECFDHLGNILASELNETDLILELGSGPGYFANYILNRFSAVSYHCLDYSEAMLNIAKNNLNPYSTRVSFQQVDLTKSNWADTVNGTYSAIVSTWALHDVGNKELIQSVYESARKLLSNSGILLNADFIKPRGISREFEAGRLLISEHLDLLATAGYSDVECTKEFEINFDEPASHNNYACFKGRHNKAVDSTATPRHASCGAGAAPRAAVSHLGR